MSTTTVKTLRARLVADTSQYNRQMAAAAKQTQKVADKMKAAGKAMTIAVTAPILAAGAAAVKFAADAEEMESKLGVVFGESADSMRAFADSLAKDTNRSSTALRSMAADTGDLLTGIGIGADQMGDMTKQIVALTQDIGSFKKARPEDVFRAITGGLVGNNEALKTLGTIITAAEIKMEAFAQTGKTVASNLIQTDKAMAALSLIARKNKQAMGDAARTAGSFTNQMLGLKGVIQDTGVKIGNVLLPVLTPVIAKLQAIVTWVGDLSPKMLKFGIIIAGVAAAIGPVLLVLGLMLPALAAIGAPILLAGAAIAGLVAIAVAFRKEIDFGFTFIFNFMADIFSKIAGNAQTFGEDLKRFLLELPQKVVRKLVDTFASLAKFMKLVFAGEFREAFEMAEEGAFQFGLAAIKSAETIVTVYDTAVSTIKQSADLALQEAFKAERVADAILERARLKREEEMAAAAAARIGTQIPGFGAPGTTDDKDEKVETTAAPGGISAFFKNLTKDISAAKLATDLASESINSFADGLADAAISGQSFGDTMKAVMQEVVKAIIKAIIKALILKSLGGLGSAFTGGGGGDAAAAKVGTSLQSGGRIPAGGFRPVGEAGMELAMGPAQIIPLSKLGGGGGNFVVNIENNSSAQVQAEDQGTNAAGDREMKLFISNTIAEDFSRGGNASRSAVQSFGLRPKTI